MYLLTQVSEDRVQVICKSSTQVNKGRVQVRLEPGSTRTGYTLQQGKQVLKAGKLLIKYSQVLQPGKHGATEETSFSGWNWEHRTRYGKIPGFEQKGMTRKTSFSSHKGETRRFHKETAGNLDKCTIQETSFPGRTGKEKQAEQEKLSDNHRYSLFKFDFESLKSTYKEGN